MTEKDYNPEQRNARAMKKQETTKIENTPIKKANEKKEDKKKAEEEKKEDGKKKSQKIFKKDEAVVNGVGLRISTKYAVAICKFIKGKKIEKAIADLNEVLKFKKVVPMKGEIPHKKGKGIMAGRYPIKATEQFVRLLKNLSANSNVNGIEEPIITEAVANKASRPYGRFGSVKRKRTHVKIVAKEKSKPKEKKK